MSEPGIRLSIHDWTILRVSITYCLETPFRCMIKIRHKRFVLEPLQENETMGQESHFGFVCDPTKGIAPQTACPAGAMSLAACANIQQLDDGEQTDKQKPVEATMQCSAGADIKQLDAEIGNQDTSHLSDVAMAHVSQDPNFVSVVLRHSQR